MRLALNPFDKGRKPEKIEDIVVSDRVKQFIEHYEVGKKFLKSTNLDTGMLNSTFDNLLKEYSMGPYSPGEIAVISNLLSKYDDFGSFYGIDWTGHLVSALIRSSAEAGNNKFTIHQDRGLVYLCFGLTDVQVEVYGSASGFFGNKCNNCNLKLFGNAGGCFGSDSKDCKFYLEGNSGGDFATAASNCSFDVGGQISIQLFFAGAYNNELRCSKEKNPEIYSLCNQGFFTKNKVIFR